MLNSRKRTNTGAITRKRKGPVREKEARKEQVARKLDYPKPEEGEQIRMHKIQKQLCKGEKELRYVQGVQSVITNLAWKKQEAEQGGITWIELYAIYMMHGGAEIDKQASEADPLRRPTLMETQLAEFKKAVREIKKHAVQESSEWHMDTC